MGRRKAEQATTLTVDTGNGPAVIKLKMTKWQVAGQVLVAFLGLCAAALGIWAGTHSEGTVDRLDGDVIPTMQKRVDELQSDNKALAATAKEMVAEVKALRDRVSWLEGALGRRPRPTWLFSGPETDTVDDMPKAAKRLDKIAGRKRVEIPMVQQAAK